jgi:NAD(P)-dependent dehydrogenase (short-subunit alcohol dehydrogenase family)
VNPARAAGAALVTGAGRRVGAALASHLARRGFHTLVHVNRSAQDGGALVAQLNASGASAELIVCDFADEGALRAMAARFMAVPAAHHVLVNNASWFGHDMPGAGDLANLDASLTAHARAPYLLLEETSRRIGASRLDVFNVLDQKLVAPNPDYYSYTIGKYALWGLTKCWRMAPVANMRVFGLLPGILLHSGEQDDQNFEASRAANLLRRPIGVSDLTDAMDLFIDNSGLPGQDVALDAGETLMGRRRDVAFDPAVHGG